MNVSRVATSEQAPPIDAGLFRRVMGRFASGVAVITAESGGQVRGMTASAFMSGSIDPPLIIVAVARRALMHGHLIAAGRFAVNILGAGQHEVANHFAGRALPAYAPEFVFEGAIPTLGGVATVITADTATTYECGDHSIFVGRIRTMTADDSPPLVYHAGKFGALASGS
ncbi:MAG TPA: flavin reductase family protein [Vicinamibacterales bacterium]|jgi:flavin reductase (DIM6/NTAB) family NADH-FMN oxidoreductase RutF|nr:flavin reductase family protein [Vicinamibacterales bacterium]